jgi:uncharacterized protein
VDRNPSCGSPAILVRCLQGNATLLANQSPETNPVKRKVVILVLCLLLLYVAYAAIVFTQQRSMMFPGIGAPHAFRATLPANARLLELPTRFGLARAVFLPANGSQARAPVVIYAHGNYETIDGNIRSMTPLNELGLHVLLVEFPGYGGAAGSPSLNSIGEAMNAGYDWLTQQSEVDPQRIIGVGRSVGGGPICELAGERKLAALVLLSTFTSIDAFAHAMWLPALLIRDPWNNLARVRDFAGPVLVFHGERDEVIPYAHGQALAADARNGRLITLACGHNGCDYFRPDHIVEIRQWLDANSLREPADALTH